MMMPKLPYSININKRILSFERPRIMGIINITPDSFFSGSRCQTRETLRQKAEEMLSEGIDIFDIGGYSSRPGADDVSPAVELERLNLGLEIIREIAPQIPISVDTFRSEVALSCINNWNVEIINDISGGTLDPEMWQMIAEKKVTYILMHMRGNPQSMSNLTDYQDVTAEVISDLAFKVDTLHSLGVADIILDPGFGFAKNITQNFELLNNLESFKSLNLPLLVGISRKSMIWKTLNCTADESANGTTVLNTIALVKGANILRVHDVKAAAQAIKLISSLQTPSQQ